MSDRLRFWRRKPPVPAQFAEAHGRRSYDGGYFCVWLCEEGHGEIGESLNPPALEKCTSCRFGNPGVELGPTGWRMATPLEAKRFLYEIEGVGIYLGVGFTLSRDVLEANEEEKRG